MVRGGWRRAKSGESALIRQLLFPALFPASFRWIVNGGASVAIKAADEGQAWRDFHTGRIIGAEIGPMAEIPSL